MEKRIKYIDYIELLIYIENPDLSLARPNQDM